MDSVDDGVVEKQLQETEIPYQRRKPVTQRDICKFAGKLAAFAITNRTHALDFVPFLWTDLFDRHITFCGDFFSTPLQNAETIVKGNLLDKNYICYILK